MAGQNYAMFGWSWTKVSVLGSQVFGQALMESCEIIVDQDKMLSEFSVTIKTRSVEKILAHLE